MNGERQHTERLRAALAEIRGETRWVRAQLPDAFGMTDQERQAIALLCDLIDEQCERVFLLRSVPEAARQLLFEISSAWHGAVMFARSDWGQSASSLLMCSGAGLIPAATAAIDAVDAAPRRPVTACA